MKLFTVEFYKQYVSTSDLTAARVLFIPFQNLLIDNSVVNNTGSIEATVSVPLDNVEVINLSHNAFNENIFPLIFQYFPNVWWLDLSNNQITSLSSLELPLALGSLDLRYNRKLRIVEFPLSLVSCHILRLSISPIVFGFKEDDLNDDWKLIKKMILELPNIWVFNDEFISLKEKTYILSTISFSTRSASFSASTSASAAASTALSEWKTTEYSLRQLLILHSIQSLQFLNEKNDFSKLDILLEEYLIQSFIFNSYVSSFFLNNNCKVKYIKFLPSLISIDLLLILPHKIRLDLSVLFTISIIFPIPDVLFRESLILLLSAYYPLESIDELMFLPSFIKTAVVSLLRRITKREKEEFRCNLFLKRKQHLPIRKWDTFYKENAGNKNSIFSQQIPTSYSSYSSFQFLKNIKYYLEDHSILTAAVPASLLPEEEILSKSFDLSDLEVDILKKLPDIPTKWSKYKTYPSDNDNVTIYNIEYAQWISFASRHAIFLFKKCPSCPSLTKLPNTLSQQNLYIDLLPILKAANMTLSDLEITNYGPGIDGRKMKSLVSTLNLDMNSPSKASNTSVNPIMARAKSEDERQLLLEIMTDTSQSQNPGDGRSSGYHKSKRRKRLESAMLFLDGKILPFGEGLIKGNLHQLVWKDNNYGNNEEEMSFRNHYSKPWNQHDRSNNLPLIEESADEGNNEQQQHQAEENTQQKAFFITSNNAEQEMIQTTAFQRSATVKSMKSPLLHPAASASSLPHYKLAREFTDTLVDVSASFRNPSIAAGGEGFTDEEKQNNPFLRNRPVSVTIDPHFPAPSSSDNRIRSLSSFDDDTASRFSPQQQERKASGVSLALRPSSSPSPKSAAGGNGVGTGGVLSQQSSLWQSENFAEKLKKSNEFFPPDPFQPKTNMIASLSRSPSASSPFSSQRNLKSREGGARKRDSYDEGINELKLNVGFDELSLDPSLTADGKKPGISDAEKELSQNHSSIFSHLQQPSQQHSIFDNPEDVDSPLSPRSPLPTSSRLVNIRATTMARMDSMVIESDNINTAMESSKSKNEVIRHLRKSLQEPPDLSAIIALEEERKRQEAEAAQLELEVQQLHKQQQQQQGAYFYQQQQQQQQQQAAANLIPKNGKLHKVDVFSADLLLENHFLMAPVNAIKQFNHYFKHSMQYDPSTIDPNEMSNSENMLNYWRSLEKPPLVVLNNKHITINNSIPSNSFNYTFTDKKKTLSSLTASSSAKGLRTNKHNNQFPSAHGRTQSPIAFTGTDFDLKSQNSSQNSEPSHGGYDDYAEPVIIMNDSLTGSIQPFSQGGHKVTSSTAVASSSSVNKRLYTNDDNLSIDDSIAFSDITGSIAVQQQQQQQQGHGKNTRKTSSPGLSQHSSFVLPPTTEGINEDLSPEKTEEEKRAKQHDQNRHLSDSFLMAIEAIQDSDDDISITKGGHDGEEESEASGEGPSYQEEYQQQQQQQQYQEEFLQYSSRDPQRGELMQEKVPFVLPATRPIFSSTPTLKKSFPSSMDKVHTPFGREVLTSEAQQLLYEMGTFRNISSLQAFNTFVYNLELNKDRKIVNNADKGALFPTYQHSGLLKNYRTHDLQEGSLDLSEASGIFVENSEVLKADSVMTDPHFDLRTIR
jgi:hypothetical protein